MEKNERKKGGVKKRRERTIEWRGTVIGERKDGEGTKGKEE